MRNWIKTIKTNHTKQSCLYIFFLRFFLMCIILKKSLLNLLQYCFCFMFWVVFFVCLFLHWDMWDLSSPTRDWTHMPCFEVKSYHWTAKEAPVHILSMTSGLFILIAHFPLSYPWLIDFVPLPVSIYSSLWGQQFFPFQVLCIWELLNSHLHCGLC